MKIIKNYKVQKAFSIVHSLLLLLLSLFSRVDSVRPHRRQPTRLPRPWDSPGKNTGVGCQPKAYSLHNQIYTARDTLFPFKTLLTSLADLIYNRYWPTLSFGHSTPATLFCFVFFLRSLNILRLLLLLRHCTGFLSA